MRFILSAFLLSTTLILTACADKSSSIQAAYISPLAYQSYDCDALEQEYARLVRKSQSINKQQDDIASSDSVATGVGLVLFWPALFFIDNDDLREQVAQLKGEVNAVEQASIQKNCMSLSNSIGQAKSNS
jgi:hypothetical protein